MDKPTIKISIDAYKKILAYTKLSEKEVLGLLEIEEVNNRGKQFLLVKNVYLPEQEVSYSSCEPTKGAMSKLMMELEDKGVDVTKIRGWWHKHPINSWSTIDDNTFKEWQKKRMYVVGLFTNQSQLKARVDFNIWGIKSSIDDINVEIDIPLDDELITECKLELDRKIKERPVVINYQKQRQQYYFPTQSHFLSEKTIEWVRIPKNWNSRQHNNTCWLDVSIKCNKTTCKNCPLYEELKDVQIYKKNGEYIYWLR